MDPQHITRLKEEQTKAITETDAQISQIEKYKNDYKQLQERLKTLPESLSHDVMVPFGKLAFMPGKLVHTNEILVLLGDNWFAERTAKQAWDIAGRRINELDSQLHKLQAQKKLLEPRLTFTSDLQGDAQDQAGVQEIVEKYDEEEEKKWDAQHRLNFRRQREEERQAQSKSSVKILPKGQEKKQERAQDEDLWARLDALEQEERERGEMESASDLESEEEEKVRNQIKSVRFQDEKSKATSMLKSSTVTHKGDGCTDDSDDEDEEDDGDESTEEEEDEVENAGDQSKRSRRPLRVIKFSHSENRPAPITPIDAAGDGPIESPADIYRLFTPASILKRNEPYDKKKASSDLEQLGSTAKGISTCSDEDMDSKCEQDSQQKPGNLLYPRGGSLKAFTGQVKETSSSPAASYTPLSRVPLPGDVSEVTAKQDPPKRVSKFKAARMAQQGSS